jgi:UDP-N-acetyl-D-galactosamine dehydrogenase
MAHLVELQDLRIGVIGLGYVGLPVAIELARHFPVVGYDADGRRVAELHDGHDRTGEAGPQDLDAAANLSITARADDLAACNFYIVTVPTPIDSAKQPDLSALRSASETVGRVISAGNIVVYESTVFPDATEGVCVPIIAEVSGLVFNNDFFAGYSPERINPGDRAHRLPDIVKIVSGSTPAAADLVEAVYGRIITAGVHRASSIRVAEAAKVIENIQRHVNIALVNELAMLFNRLDLDTAEVLQAACTKWNFHHYTPGLVGGHCIGIDPYYLTHKAQSVGFHPDMILAGRRINDSMAGFVAGEVIAEMLRRKLSVDKARVLILGLTFKANCPDIRNTKVADLYQRFAELGIAAAVYDPFADAAQAKHEYGIELHTKLPGGPYEAVVLAVDHEVVLQQDLPKIPQVLTAGGFVYDIKSVLPPGSDVVRL